MKWNVRGKNVFLQHLRPARCGKLGDVACLHCSGPGMEARGRITGKLLCGPGAGEPAPAFFFYSLLPAVIGVVASYCYTDDIPC